MSLAISRHIHAVLSSGLAEELGNRLFPISTVMETSFPFVVYERSSVGTFYTKDGAAQDTVRVTVYVLAETYAESVNIAESVRMELEGVTAEYDSFDVLDSVFVGASEAYDNNTFVQSLVFEFTTKLKY